MLDPLILRTISIGFGLLFLLAAVHKFSTAQQFRVILEQYQVMPQGLAGPVARIVPLLEVLLSIGWFTAYRPELVAISSAVLLAAYTAAIGLNLLRGRIHIGCGCGVGGSADGDQQLSSGLILRNSYSHCDRPCCRDSGNRSAICCSGLRNSRHHIAGERTTLCRCQPVAGEWRRNRHLEEQA